MQSTAFRITKEQIEKLRPYLPNIDELVLDYEEFQTKLDDAIIDELDENYDDTEVSIMLQRIYDEIYKQNDYSTGPRAFFIGKRRQASELVFFYAVAGRRKSARIHRRVQQEPQRVVTLRKRQNKKHLNTLL